MISFFPKFSRNANAIGGYRIQNIVFFCANDVVDVHCYKQVGLPEALPRKYFFVIICNMPCKYRC